MRASRPALIAAFTTLYLIWGSTYLAIRIAVEYLPPFLMAGARFGLAGLVLMLWMRWKGIPFPTRRQWLGVTAVGTCLVVFSNVPVVWAEQKISSGVVAMFAAGTPLLITLFNVQRTGTQLGRRRATGLALGTLGMALLGSATFHAFGDPIRLMILSTASLAWAIGSTYGRDWGGPPNLLMASGGQMLAGGAMAFAIGIAAGELTTLSHTAVPLRSILAWTYLAVFGSLIAFPVFQWLMAVADATAVSSYTYVNPMIALLLGTLLAGERITFRIALASAVLIPAVVLVVTGSRKSELEMQEEP